LVPEVDSPEKEDCMNKNMKETLGFLSVLVLFALALASGLYIRDLGYQKMQAEAAELNTNSAKADHGLALDDLMGFKCPDGARCNTPETFEIILEEVLEQTQERLGNSVESALSDPAGWVTEMRCSEIAEQRCFEIICNFAMGEDETCSTGEVIQHLVNLLSDEDAVTSVYIKDVTGFDEQHARNRHHAQVFYKD